MRFYPNQTVQKSYCWKNLIPFGAAGTGALVQQVANFMATSEPDYEADEAGFLQAFKDARAKVFSAINSSKDPLKKAVASATVLAAIPALSALAHILRLVLERAA